MKKLLTISALMTALVLTMAAGGRCSGNPKPSADQRESQQTAQIAERASQAVGMPGINNFREKRRVRRLYELRDDALTTYTYIRNIMTNELTFLCESVGYGINASIQFSNPERVAHKQHYSGGSFGTLPQPEPNGLFMPEGLAATYVECANPDPKKEPMAVYVEDPIIVSPFKLRAAGSYAAPK